MPDEHEACITTHESVRAVPRRDRPLPCRRRGLHYATCEEPESCRGCVPRSSAVGFLCPVCHRRLVDALGRLAWLISHLRSISRPAQAIGERVDTSMERSILLPDPWIAADELMTALGAKVIPSTASIDDAIALAHTAVNIDVDSWVSTIEGATQAVILLRRMDTALKRWPDSEAQFRPIPYVRCANCGEPHLWRSAPEHFGDDLRVVCGTPECGYTTGYDEWADKYAPVFAALEADMKRREKAARKERT